MKQNRDTVNKKNGDIFLPHRIQHSALGDCLQKHEWTKRVLRKAGAVYRKMGLQSKYPATSDTWLTKFAFFFGDIQYLPMSIWSI